MGASGPPLHLKPERKVKRIHIPIVWWPHSLVLECDAVSYEGLSNFSSMSGGPILLKDDFALGKFICTRRSRLT
uniref:Uncharacterized protein n=1 Tax=Lepeophtheirus salmonis TaxID=72036 RepID=A0A0K2UBB8_LEPSM